MSELKKALSALGFKSGSRVQVYGRVNSRVWVIVNGKAIGIYDIERKTFVD